MNVQPGRTLPSECDPSFYRQRYDDLHRFDDQQLLDHFETHGRAAGRHAAAPAMRSQFVKLFSDIRPILERGPLDAPLVTGEGVSYFDVLDQGALTAYTRNAGRSGTVPYVDFVSPTADLSIIDRKFAALCSSHCIEHQPDLITHFRRAGDLLDAGGLYFLLVPDKRYCFDHFTPESNVGDVIEAYEDRRSRHTLSSLIKQIGFSTHNSAFRHWNGDHADAGYADALPDRVQKAIKTFRGAGSSYIDCHAWRFTPSTFRQIVDILHKIDLIPFRPLRVYDTVRGQLEFTTILERT